MAELIMCITDEKQVINNSGKAAAVCRSLYSIKSYITQVNRYNLY